MNEEKQQTAERDERYYNRTVIAEFTPSVTHEKGSILCTIGLHTGHLQGHYL